MKRDVFESRICWPGVFSSNINQSGQFCNKLIKVYQMYINLFLIFMPCCRVLPLPKRMRIRTLRHYCLHPVNGSIYFSYPVFCWHELLFMLCLSLSEVWLTMSPAIIGWETLCTSHSGWIPVSNTQSNWNLSVLCVSPADECPIPVIQTTCLPKQVKSLWSGSAFFGGRCRADTCWSPTHWVLEVCWHWATTCSSAGRFTRSLAKSAVGRGQVRGDSSFKASCHWNYSLPVLYDYVLYKKVCQKGK